jgi:hypothetical protein
LHGLNTIGIRNDSRSSSREESHSQQGRQQQQQDLITGTLVTVGRTAAETIEHHRKVEPATSWSPATDETPTTVLTSAGMPTATKMAETAWTPTTSDFWGKFRKKTRQNGKNL